MSKLSNGRVLEQLSGATTDQKGDIFSDDVQRISIKVLCRLMYWVPGRFNRSSCLRSLSHARCLWVTVHIEMLQTRCFGTNGNLICLHCPLKRGSALLQAIRALLPIHTGSNALCDAKKWSQVSFVRVTLYCLLLGVQCAQDCCYNRICVQICFASCVACGVEGYEDVVDFVL